MQKGRSRAIPIQSVTLMLRYFNVGFYGQLSIAILCHLSTSTEAGRDSLVACALHFLVIPRPSPQPALRSSHLQARG
jgi:hypothetical protein